MDISNLVDEALECGKQAMREGKASAPFRDENIMRIVAEYNTKFEFGWTSAIFDAWAKGYHSMILGGELYKS
jgi:hypothetical protein